MEKNIIRKQLFKNLLLTFITFLILLVFFDFLIYGVVSNTILKSVDDELKLGKASYEWQYNASSIIEDADSTVSAEQTSSSNTEYKVILLNNPVEDNKNDLNDFKPIEEPKKEEQVPPNNQNNNELSKQNKKTEKEKKEKRQEIIDNSGIDNSNTQELKEYIDKLNTINPRLIVIERDENGNITNSDEIGSLYNSYKDSLFFDSTDIDNTYDIEIEDFNYRGLNFKNEDTNTYVQLLINIDSEIKSIDNVLKTITLGSGMILLISLIASYILSKRTLKPIIDSYQKEIEFVQNASHELRTPLTIIQAKQELLLQEPNSKIITKSEDINISLQETRRLTKLIKELMILAKSDSEKYELNKEEVDVDKLINDLLTPYIELYNNQDRIIELDLNYRKKYKLDKDKISELLIILFDNAIKYTKEKDHIIVKTFEENKKLVIEIQDTGIGISDKSIKRIFDRFYREDKSHSRKIGGNGLGLSIAQIIVNSHNGTIKASHNKPKGTIFTIKI